MSPLFTFTLFLSILSLWISVVRGQDGDDDKVKWVDLPGWAGIRPCARSCLTVDIDVHFGDDDITIHLGCQTPRCICRADHLFIARQFVYLCALRRCAAPGGGGGAGTADGEALQKLVRDFCAARGYTAISTVIDTVTVADTGTINPPSSVVSTPTPTSGISAAASNVPIPTPKLQSAAQAIDIPRAGLYLAFVVTALAAL